MQSCDMLSRSVLLAVLLSLFSVARTQVVPTQPGPGVVSNAGSTCTIAWTIDPTGQWKTTNIELMTGNNEAMVHLTTVTTVDGTANGPVASFTWPCPAVTVNAPIYFYQLSSPSAPTNKTWTTRFTIAGTDGQTVSAPNALEPDGQGPPWGIGALSDPSKATPAPSYLGNSSDTSSNSTSPSSTASSSSSSSSSSPSASTSGFVTSASPAPTPTQTTNNAQAGNSSNSAGSSSANSSGLTLSPVSTLAAQAGVALALVAGTFTLVL